MIGEFDIIARYFTRPGSDSDVVLGIGDDAAVLAVGGRSREVPRDDLELADQDAFPGLAGAARSSRELLSRTAFTNLKLSVAP